MQLDCLLEPAFLRDADFGQWGLMVAPWKPLLRINGKLLPRCAGILFADNFWVG